MLWLALLLLLFLLLRCCLHAVQLIEDCAECFAGPAGYRGHPSSDIVLFSFGSIKTSTAFGGGIALIPDQKLYHRIDSLHRYALLLARPRSVLSFHSRSIASDWLGLFLVRTPCSRGPSS